MNVIELADLLSGRCRGDEITPEQEQLAKDNNLVVVFGASDDLVELRGAIEDEQSCYDGGQFFVLQNGLISKDHECDCDFCGFKVLTQNHKTLVVEWNDSGNPCWECNIVDVESYPFSIMDDDNPEEVFCRGIVFNRGDL